MTMIDLSLIKIDSMFDIADIAESDSKKIAKKTRTIDDRNCLVDYFGKFLADSLNFDMTTGPWLAGGAVRKSFLGQSIESSDWDIWFSSYLQFSRAVQTMTKIGASQVHRSANSYTFKYSGLSVYDTSQTIQLVMKNYYSSPKEIIDNFDFTICQLVTDGRSMLFGEKTLYDLNHRLIRHTKDSLADNVIGRMVKYMIYGYEPSAELLDLIDSKLDQIDFGKYTHEYDSV